MVSSGQKHNPCGIYAIRSDVNEHSYIGHSSNIRARWKKHRYELRKEVHGNEHLQRAWNKYGESEFEFVVLEECSVELLIEREQSYLDLTPNNYNILPVAGSPRGYKHTSEAKAKISDALTGREKSPEQRKRISDALKGNQNAVGSVRSPERRAEIGAANRRRVVSEETKGRTSAALKGRKHTEEAKANMSAAKMGHAVSDETRERLRQANTGRKASEETRERMSASHTGRKHTPESKAKIGAAAKDRAALKREEKAAAA